MVILLFRNFVRQVYALLHVEGYSWMHVVGLIHASHVMVRDQLV